MARVLSCIQPTGQVHLGNYLGALRNWVSGQHAGDVFHGIVDLHALTVTETPGVLGENTLDLAAMLFAVGLDPDVATIFVQSHVPEHTQLGWIMECTVSFGELSRMALQAADILLYDADEVPVGDDQRQHIEITRDIALRFNHRFGDTFVIPKAVTPAAGARVMDLLHPTNKMSKSTDTDAGIIYLTDNAADIEKKFKRAVTDSDNVVAYDREKKPGVSNLLDILSVATNTPVATLVDQYSQYGKLKADTGAAVSALIEPIRSRYLELKNDPAELSRLLRIGADRAHAVASSTLARAYRAIGLAPR
ncbi:MAG: tryptophan--tRNA ligase [Actinobacteria bacterium]|nr:tryptophan--tRNA ligase [Actinomycetota bacterium]